MIRIKGIETLEMSKVGIGVGQMTIAEWQKTGPHSISNGHSSVKNNTQDDVSWLTDSLDSPKSNYFIPKSEIQIDSRTILKFPELRFTIFRKRVEWVWLS